MRRARGPASYPPGPIVWSLRCPQPPEAIQTVPHASAFDLNTRGTAKLCPWGNILLKNHESNSVSGLLLAYRNLPVSALVIAESTFRSRLVRRLRLPVLATRSFFFGVRRLFGTIQAQPVSAFVPNCPGRQQGATRGTGTVRAGDGRRQSSSRP
jgi:hypothetical protein